MDHLKLQVGDICNLTGNDSQKVSSEKSFSDLVSHFINSNHAHPPKQLSVSVWGWHNAPAQEIIKAGISNIKSTHGPIEITWLMGIPAFDKNLLKEMIDWAMKMELKTIHLDQSQSTYFGNAAEYREIYFYALKHEVDLKIIWPSESDLEVIHQWTELMSRPLYYKKMDKLEVVSAYELSEVDHLINAFIKNITMLESELWPLKKRILLNISKYPEEFKFACAQDYIPDWVIATTGGERSFYQLGTKITDALVHELTHLFISQRHLQFPNWFSEGFCELVQDKRINKAFLKTSLKTKNLFEILSKNQNKNLILIEMDKNFPFENPLYQQAKAFVAYLEAYLGKALFNDFLIQCETCQLEEAFLKIGTISLKEHIENFCQENS